MREHPKLTERYTITMKTKLSCTWHQFTPKAGPCKSSTPVRHE